MITKTIPKNKRKKGVSNRMMEEVINHPGEGLGRTGEDLVGIGGIDATLSGLEVWLCIDPR